MVIASEAAVIASEAHVTLSEAKGLKDGRRFFAMLRMTKTIRIWSGATLGFDRELEL